LQYVLQCALPAFSNSDIAYAEKQTVAVWCSVVQWCCSVCSNMCCSVCCSVCCSMCCRVFRSEFYLLHQIATSHILRSRLLQCGAGCCSVVQCCSKAKRSVLRRKPCDCWAMETQVVAAYCSVHCSVCNAYCSVCCNELHFVAVSCNLLQCVAVLLRSNAVLLQSIAVLLQGNEAYLKEKMMCT